MADIGVLGTGTWGISLARHLALNCGHNVLCWSALPEEIDYFRATKRHPNLPGVPIPDSISYTKDIEKAVTGKDIVMFAVPSVFVRSTAKLAAPFLKEGQIVVDVAKGFESSTRMSMTEVIADEVKKDIKLVALSGPTHAEEVAVDLPTSIVSASSDLSVAEYVQDIYMAGNLRVYTNHDIKGVELCGSLKNVIALAVGCSDGMGFGDNTKAALITRGMSEIAALGSAMGCEPQTFYGLAGIGDLIVTATSVHSRNNKCGNLVGKGYPVKKAIEKVGMVVEGINCLPAAIELMKQYDVEMPIVMAVNAVVNEGKSPKDMVALLMGRDKTHEFN